MSKVVFSDWAEEWLEYKRRYVKESTYANYLIFMRNQLIPALGNEYIGDINSVKIQEKIDWWAEKGRIDGRGELSQKTVRDIVTILKMCIRDYAKTNRQEPPFFTVKYPPAKGRKRMDILSHEQQENLLAVIRQDKGYETLGYALSLYTGIRIGELCALKWADIDMEKRQIIIDKTLQRIYLKGRDNKKGKTKIIITSPKSENAVRNIPISEALLELLKSRACTEREKYLLTGTEKYIEPRLYRKHYRKFLIENQAEYIRFHGLRHTFATRCVEHGANYKAVSELLGHASVDLTLNLYVHPQWEEKRKCVELI